MRILMVHGIAQGGKIADELKATWTQTLQAGFKNCNSPWPSDIKVDFPYYGDMLDGFSAEAAARSTVGLATKGTGENLEFEQFKQSALDEMQRSGAISDSEVRQELDPGALQEKGIQNHAWVQAIARAIDKRMRRTTSFTIENFLRDVHLYVSKREIARQIDATVEAMLTDEPTILIGHSLGSVVAYNVAKKNKKTLKLRKFITVGSPLGLRVVSSKLGIAENPAGIDGWYNAYDDRDIVALNPLDDTHFPADPPVVNSNHVDNSTDNRHGIIGYLNDSKIAAQIAQALV